MRDAFGRPGRVALVGGTSDIGLAILTHLSPDEVVLVGRSQPRLSAVSIHGKKTVVLAEAIDTGAHRQAIGSAFEGGDIDCAVVAIGDLGQDARTPEERTTLSNVNYTGSLSLLLHTAERMKEQAHGSIVVLSSVAAARPRPSNWVYGATKAGLDFASRGLAIELEGSGVSVLLIRLGFVRSRMTANSHEVPLSISADAAGERIAELVRRRMEGAVFVPSSVRWIWHLLGILPQRLVNRLDRG